MASYFIQLPSAANVTAGVASFKGRTGVVVPSTNDYSFAQINGGQAAVDAAVAVRQEVQSPPTEVLAITASHTTIQAAVTYAETLGAATSATGVVISIPAGDYAENVLIKKNISLVGSVAAATKILSVTYRPSSNAAGPTSARCTNVSIDTLNVLAETAAASGVFWADMFLDGALRLISCMVKDVNLNRQNNIVLDTCFVMDSSIIDCVDCADVRFNHCVLNDVAFSIDGTDSNLPSKIDPMDSPFGLLYNTQSIINGDTTLTKPAGTIDVNFLNEGGFVYSLVANDGTSIYARGGQIYARTLNGSVNVAEYSSYSPYTPVEPLNWDVQPSSVDAALDELAARVRALEP